MDTLQCVLLCCQPGGSTAQPRGLPVDGKEGRVWELMVTVHRTIGVEEALGTLRELVGQTKSEARHKQELGMKNQTMPPCGERTGK